MKVLLKVEKDEYSLAKGTYEIYRGNKTDISPVPVFLKGPNYENGRIIANNQGVSHRHLQISVLEDSVELKDLKSRFGSRLDGKSFDEYKIDQKGKYVLELGEVVNLELIVK